LYCYRKFGRRRRLLEETQMEQSSHRLAPALIAAAGAIAGFVLRRWQLRAAFDAAGQAVPGHGSSLLLALVCAAAVLLLALLSTRLEPRGGYEESFSSGAPELALSALAALAMLLSCALSLLGRPAGLWLVMGFLGLLAGFCIALSAAQRYRGTVPPLALHILPCVYLAARLIFMFKSWSVDPVVQDYCYELFASISAMLATYHLGGFCLGRGQRRMCAFWCLTGTVFSAVALAGAGLEARLLFAACGLWCAVNGWQLLED